MIKKEALRGYILEEALAYLLRSSGYRLFINATQDTENLRNGHAGIEVRGRGGFHQADVLGQLEIIPAFSYPFRLFIEAKHHKKKVDMPIVRNAVGIVTDVNQAPYYTDTVYNLPCHLSYHYAYAIFSASGFDEPAVRMATSYLISLVDLSMKEYKDLLNAIDKTAKMIKMKYKNLEGLVKSVRYSLRNTLRTYSDEFIIEPPNNFGSHYSNLASTLATLVNVIKKYDKLYIGTINAPFILVLKPDNPKKFEDYVFKYNQSEHKVEIHWDSSIDNGNTWFITPVQGDLNEKYKMTFKLPTFLSKWIFEVETERQQKAMQAKTRYFSSINIYIRGEGFDRVVKLKFDPQATMRAR